MRPAGLMSKKFTDAQRSYFTTKCVWSSFLRSGGHDSRIVPALEIYEHETLGVIEALKKWDDVLLGLSEIRVVTDHQALQTFMQKAHAGPRQIQWSQWLTRFKIIFIHIPGSENCSADALSRIYENPNVQPQREDLSTVDLLLDTYGDNLPEACLKEKETLYMAAMMRKAKLREVVEPRVREAQDLDRL